MGSPRIRIALDAMGGDFAPDVVVAGALKAQAELDVDVLLVGEPQILENLLQQHQTPHGLTIIPSEGIIEMHEEPLSALKRKPKSSINVAMDLVKQKQADAVVSAGHSGAAMAAALLRLGRLPGIERPAIGAVFPTMIPNKLVLLLDVGANVDCRPKFLEQFGVMGSIYSQYVLGIHKPQVGLLNIGEEASKGNELALKAYQLLENNPSINFIGNAEGRDILSGRFDVVVCDGFVGNVVLKFAEAVGEIMLRIVKEELSVGLEDNQAPSLLGPIMRFKKRVDHVEHGGGLLLGVAGVCIISHGASQAPSIFNAIRLAKGAIENQVIEQIKTQSIQAKETEATATT